MNSSFDSIITQLKLIYALITQENLLKVFLKDSLPHFNESILTSLFATINPLLLYSTKLQKILFY